MNYLQFDFGSAWRKADLEGKINLCREATVEWTKLENLLYESVKEMSIYSPERGYVSYLEHDGNRDIGLLDFMIHTHDRGGIDFQRINAFTGSLWRAYANQVCWIRHGQIYLRMRELEKK